MQAQAMVGSEAGQLSGHDVRRVMLHVVQMSIGTGLTVLAENLGGLGLGAGPGVDPRRAAGLLRRLPPHADGGDSDVDDSDG